MKYYITLFSPKALDVDGVMVFRNEHALVAVDLVDRRNFLLKSFTLDQVDVLVLLYLTR